MFNDELRKDLLTAALEGGSNYWYLIVDVSVINISTIDDIEIPERNVSFVDHLWYFIEKGGTLPIYDVEDPDEKLGDFNMKGIEEGETILQNLYKHTYKRIKKADWDANDADYWFQLVILKDIVFN